MRNTSAPRSAAWLGRGSILRPRSQRSHNLPRQHPRAPIIYSMFTAPREKSQPRGGVSSARDGFVTKKITLQLRPQSNQRFEWVQFLRISWRSRQQALTIYERVTIVAAILLRVVAAVTFSSLTPPHCVRPVRPTHVLLYYTSSLSPLSSASSPIIQTKETINIAILKLCRCEYMSDDKLRKPKQGHLRVDDAGSHIQDGANDAGASSRRREVQRGTPIAVADAVTGCTHNARRCVNGDKYIARFARATAQQ